MNAPRDRGRLYRSEESVLAGSHTGSGRRHTEPSHGRMSSLERRGKKVRNSARGEAKKSTSVEALCSVDFNSTNWKAPRSDFLRKSPSKKKKKKKRSKRTPLKWARGRERALCARATLVGILNRESDLIGRSCRV